MNTERNRARPANPLNRPNPLDAIVPALAGPAPEAQRLAPGAGVSAGRMWGRVVSVNPLRVVIPPDTSASATTPVSLVPLSDLAPGVAVRVEWQGRTMVVAGRVWTEAERVAAEAAEAASAWKPLALASGWSQYSTASSWGTPEYRVVAGRVEFSGMVAGTMGKDTPIATVPPEAAPRRNRIFSGIENYTPISVQCSTGGLLYANPVRSTPWLSLSSLSYPL